LHKDYSWSEDNLLGLRRKAISSPKPKAESLKLFKNILEMKKQG